MSRVIRVFFFFVVFLPCREMIFSESLCTLTDRETLSSVYNGVTLGCVHECKFRVSFAQYSQKRFVDDLSKGGLFSDFPPSPRVV